MSVTADALGLQAEVRPREAGAAPRSRETLEQEVWAQLKQCYDPEIPVNVVDLGLIYDCALARWRFRHL
jgi:metal-sulfur cluster biosynthetic enzyme